MPRAAPEEVALLGMLRAQLLAPLRLDLIEPAFEAGRKSAGMIVALSMEPCPARP